MSQSRRGKDTFSAAQRLRESSDAEQALLEGERDAEQALDKANARLKQEEKAFSKARKRYERRCREVEAATATLIERQTARAAGPDRPTAVRASSDSGPVPQPRSDASPKPDS